MDMSKLSKNSSTSPPSVSKNPPSISFVSKVKKIDKVDEPDMDKSEWIKLESLMDLRANLLYTKTNTGRAVKLRIAL
jgi:hypothetical protein